MFFGSHRLIGLVYLEDAEYASGFILFVSGCKKCRRGSYSATKVIINFPVILYLLSEDLAIDLSEILSFGVTVQPSG